MRGCFSDGRRCEGLSEWMYVIERVCNGTYFLLEGKTQNQNEECHQFPGLSIVTQQARCRDEADAMGTEDEMTQKTKTKQNNAKPTASGVSVTPAVVFTPHTFFHPFCKHIPSI